MPTKLTTLESLPELLERLALEDGSGRIVVGSAVPVAEIWIEGRVVVDAASESSNRRLVARLRSTGHASEADVRRAERAAASKGTRLIRALSGKVRSDVLETIARDEARFALAAALASRPEEVGFDPGAAPPAATCSIDAGELLAQAQTFLDTLGPAQAFAPAAAVPHATGLDDGGGLSIEEQALLTRCDGTRSVRDLAEECGLPHPEVSVLVDRMARLGLLSVDAVDEAAALIAELEAATTMAVEAIRETDDRALDDELVIETTAPEVELETPIDEEEQPVVVEHAPIPVTGHAGVDTVALLRELSALGRERGPARR